MSVDLFLIVLLYITNSGTNLNSMTFQNQIKKL